MYRPGKVPQGKWARFLQSQRIARDWSVQQAFEELHEGLGYKPKSRAAYDKFDHGPTEPSDEQKAFLVEFYGARPSDEPEPIQVVESSNEALLSAVNLLVAEIREERALLLRLVKGLVEGEVDIETASRAAASLGSAPTSLPREGAQR